MRCCKDCDVRFETPTAYSSHMRRKHSKFSCPYCGKVFGVRRKMTCHLRACSRIRNKKNQESGTIISCLNYKRLPIVTAQELDTEFELYINRKFGKKSIFRNEKMCKFCCKTFVMASDFADHIRGHYKSISLDATGVKSKFDFMNFMGLKIRDTNEIGCSDTEIANKQKNETTECRVVIIGERCEICYEFFKCRTDLDHHNKVYHPPNNRNEIILVFRIGKEIISKIPLKKCYIRCKQKTACRSDESKQSRTQLNELYNDGISEYSSNVGEKDKEPQTVWPTRESPLSNEIYDVSQSCELIDRQEDLQSVIPSEKERPVLRLQNKVNYTDGNMIRSVDETENEFGLPMLSYKTKVGVYDFESSQLYPDACVDSLQFSAPWKDELIYHTESWYTRIKLEEGEAASDEESCYCGEPIGPRLTLKERSTWEQEHYEAMLNEESGSCHKMSFHKFPSIYNYSCGSNYQSDSSFSLDEESYGFQVETEDNEETNNDEKYVNHNIDEGCIFGYKGAITFEDKRTNLMVNHARSDIHQCDDKPLQFQNLGTGKAAVNAINEYQEVLIKEEVMLDDCTCCINDVYPSLSHLSA